ncbi:bifunctional proline dehydrogenase/L-glutamate gamma-semialdehyde dehydrogenase PutA [Candidatus Carsonella ruddii]|uniref:Bifunctional protein PutA n=6 Tax=cellular organisms TaxID=131567 RepID=A0AAJ6FH31_CARRU|nr:bifunctional proline dehydrogenase/L-glutamate gamma-semialdehyde dehydrogenase PutA [Candidatus Carsonella ruddii]WGS66758.1 bifunctional proline dehydrogenase/L-glutamate gamma-semialdehyde dehydrogenase PutA [Candidatus Carsonella ruddii]WGS66952.1 bifunctional proline dehydrogenase/L-glutamate gamma-semialdehyde dehydrogenase PutA [Candidatus Carsonella ruddii]WGS67143.1 bifunctional proline dehydrogenase/L-glutamate gamma-semialdehyde dehydrogenase PutA [Candidatus Carsonella ruddii]WGS
MIFNFLLNIVSKHYLIDESIYLLEVLKRCFFKYNFFEKVETFSNNLINESRKTIVLDNVDNLLNEYNLSTKEGIQMMCLAESLLRIPDFFTTNSFIKDKISFQEWENYYCSDYWKIVVYNMTIDLISKLFYKNNIITDERLFIFLFRRIIFKFSNYLMKNIGKKFVYSNNSYSAIQKALSDKSLFSFDMLGEAAITYYDANKFFNQYLKLIDNIKKNFIGGYRNKVPTISIKLSALHPKYSFYNKKDVVDKLALMLKILILKVKDTNSSLTIDAEECDRMELNLELFNILFYSGYCLYWNKFGLVIQAYSKRALPALYWINKVAFMRQTKIPVRLVKGAYWDYEIKFIQSLNLNLYPVYTKKFCTDLSYLLCSHYLLSKKCNNNIFPQFATHNIQTISCIIVLSQGRHLEFQKLYGMGDNVYQALKKMHSITCREYAPIGTYKELLPYLVRRLLENGANSSFVNKLLDKECEIIELTKCPLLKKDKKYNKNLPNPIDLFGGRRLPYLFYNLNISFHYYIFFKKILFFEKKNWIANSFNNYKKNKIVSFSPLNEYSIIGIVKHDNNINASIRILKKSFNYWRLISVEKKVSMIRKFIILLKVNFLELIVLCCKEAGKTILDAIADIKEAIDFCKYYASQALAICNKMYLPNYTGENNIYIIEGKGIIATISPWNFPVAIFCGQTISALIAGNVVLAKPAESTSLIAYKIFQLLYKSGVPISVCQIIFGQGSNIGNKISFHKDIYGVIFTGSNQIANLINKNLIMRDNRPIHKLIAETGGINTMIADCSTLIEQLVVDVLESSFKSCGQRCSALRLLYIHEDIYEETIKLIFGAMRTFSLGHTLDTTNDIGPIITKRNRRNLLDYLYSIHSKYSFCTEKIKNFGNYILPHIIRVNGILDLKSEYFGPILHVSMFNNSQVNDIINDINSVEFGLTLGIHSRNESFYKYVANKLNIGNIYINRNTIGAIVGMQPFGGCNLSGTGPKAGGANYLASLITEKTITVNTTAQGGNVELLNE